MALSPSGTLVYATGAAGAAGAELVWVSREGVATPVDSAWVIPGVTGTVDIALSPDGQRIAASISAGQARDIWVKQLPRGPFTRLTFDGDTRRPVWTRDGRSLLYLRAGDAGGTLRSRPANGTGAEETIASLDGSIVAAERTADSTRFLLVARLGRLRDIVLFERGGSPVPLLASERFEEVGPALSPDGRWLAYVSDESDRNEVYVRPYPEVDGGRWQVSRNGGSEARWSHSGRELFYRDDAHALVAVEVMAGDGFATGAERALFSTSAFARDRVYHMYQVAPGDSSFLFVRGTNTGVEDAGATTVVVVDNWFEELKARAPR
jgi:hypothetical protein